MSHPGQRRYACLELAASESFRLRLDADLGPQTATLRFRIEDHGQLVLDQLRAEVATRPLPPPLISLELEEEKAPIGNSRHFSAVARLSAPAVRMTDIIPIAALLVDVLTG